MRRMMTKLVCTSPVGAHYWPEWNAFCDDPGAASDEDAMRLAVLPWRRAHRAAHGCSTETPKCTSCGCYCCYHQIGGQCFGRTPIINRRLDPLLRDVDDVPLRHARLGCIIFRDPVAYFYCACPGMS
jgi:hypothetical protein